jgi:hypothetical protein|tara:strand:- start:832 stop:1371 length:540 start_codon:yes stop_codon:yes gene_type:complete
MMLERDIQESIRAAAKDFGWSSLNGGFFYHTWNSQKSEKGFPDIFMSNGSDLIVAEVKRNKPHGVLTPEQYNILNILSKHIALTFLWREDDLQEAYEVLANPDMKAGNPECPTVEPISDLHPPIRYSRRCAIGMTGSGRFCDEGNFMCDKGFKSLWRNRKEEHEKKNKTIIATKTRNST